MIWFEAVLVYLVNHPGICFICPNSVKRGKRLCCGYLSSTPLVVVPEAS